MQNFKKISVHAGGGFGDLKIEHVMRPFTEAMKATKALEGKRVVLLLGGTGQGKSTSIRAANGQAMKTVYKVKYQTGAEGIVDDWKPIKAQIIKSQTKAIVVPANPDVDGPAIGSSSVSCTKFANGYLDQEGKFYWVDTGGFGENRNDETAVANAISAYLVARRASQVSLIVVSGYNSEMQDLRMTGTERTLNDFFIRFLNLSQARETRFNQSVLFLGTFPKYVMDNEEETAGPADIVARLKTMHHDRAEAMKTESDPAQLERIVGILRFLLRGDGTEDSEGAFVATLDPLDADSVQAFRAQVKALNPMALEGDDIRVPFSAEILPKVRQIFTQSAFSGQLSLNDHGHKVRFRDQLTKDIQALQEEIDGNQQNIARLRPLIGGSFEAIKAELSAELAELETRIKSLEATVTALEAQEKVYREQISTLDASKKLVVETKIPVRTGVADATYVEEALLGTTGTIVALTLGALAAAGGALAGGLTKELAHVDLKDAPADAGKRLAETAKAAVDVKIKKAKPNSAKEPISFNRGMVIRQVKFGEPGPGEKWTWEKKTSLPSDPDQSSENEFKAVLVSEPGKSAESWVEIWVYERDSTATKNQIKELEQKSRQTLQTLLHERDQLAGLKQRASQKSELLKQKEVTDQEIKKLEALAVKLSAQKAERETEQTSLNSEITQVEITLNGTLKEQYDTILYFNEQLGLNLLDDPTIRAFVEGFNHFKAPK